MVDVCIIRNRGQYDMVDWMILEVPGLTGKPSNPLGMLAETL